MQTIEINLGARAYPIHIGRGLLEQAHYFNQHLRGGAVAVVTDETVAPLYLERLHTALDGATVTDIVLPAGEEYKTLATLEHICTRLLEANVGRDGTLIVLGGGVVGDTGGFAAASYQRGIDFIQVPTTLLAQVDSSVGGKTGVNHALGKNMIGAFYQPRAVVSDLNALDSLPARHFSAGVAEIIKYGLILDGEFFVWLERNIDALMARDEAALTHVIVRSCEIKAQVVAQDELESGGHRMLLNLGHTFGHALEAAMSYGEWLHGEAVGCGLLLAAALSHDLGYLGDTEVERIAALLERAKLPREIPPQLNPDQMLDLMARDKKNVTGKQRLILLEKIGSAFIEDTVTREKIGAFLTAVHRS